MHSVHQSHWKYEQVTRVDCRDNVVLEREDPFGAPHIGYSEIEQVLGDEFFLVGYEPADETDNGRISEKYFELYIPRLSLNTEFCTMQGDMSFIDHAHTQGDIHFNEFIERFRTMETERKLHDLVYFDRAPADYEGANLSFVHTTRFDGSGVSTARIIEVGERSNPYVIAIVEKRYRESRDAWAMIASCGEDIRTKAVASSFCVEKLLDS